MGTLERALFLASCEAAPDLQIVLGDSVKSTRRLVELLRPIAKSCRSLSVVLCPSKKGTAINAELASAVGAVSRAFASEGRSIEVVRCMDVLPSCLILDRRFVALGWGAWFEAAPYDPAQFGFVFEAPAFVSTLQGIIVATGVAESR